MPPSLTGCTASPKPGPRSVHGGNPTLGFPAAVKLCPALLCPGPSAPAEFFQRPRFQIPATKSAAQCSDPSSQGSDHMSKNDSTKVQLGKYMSLLGLLKILWRWTTYRGTGATQTPTSTWVMTFEAASLELSAWLAGSPACQGCLPSTGASKTSRRGAGIKARLGTGGPAERKAGVPGIAQQGQSVRGPWPQSTSHV